MKTYSFTTDAAGPDEAIVTQSCCGKIVLYEDGQVGTADYKIRAPLATDAQITRPAGAKTEMVCPPHRPWWSAGETIGYISAATGSLTMVQEEY